MKIEHIGIAVNDSEQANQLFKDLLGEEHYKVEVVESEGVITSFFKAGDSKIELLESTTSDGPIARFIERRGPGIHHLALEVDDIHQEMKRLQQKGFQLINEEPKKGADNKLVCFLHPKSTGGILVELCQKIK